MTPIIYIKVSLKTIPFYTDYFKIGYPLPKLDLIAVGDMASGINCLNNNLNDTK